VARASQHESNSAAAAVTAATSSGPPRSVLPYNGSSISSRWPLAWNGASECTLAL
jgi:hypothetical protein